MKFTNFVSEVAGSWPLAPLGLFCSRQRPLVLLYHGVSNRTATGSENYRGKHIPFRDFEAQIIWLKHHFTIVPLQTIEEMTLAQEKSTKPLCAITFDDGYQNNFLNAFPILQRHQVPATIFITTDFIDKGTPLWPDVLEYALNYTSVPELSVTWEDITTHYSLKNTIEKITADDSIRRKLKTLSEIERQRILLEIVKTTHANLALALKNEPDYAPLTWDEVETMTNHDITIGAHTLNHPILSSQSQADQQREIVLSSDRIYAKLGQCRHFAYPNGQPGDWGPETTAILKNKGYAAAWTTEMRRVNLRAETDPFALPRITVDRGHQHQRFEALTSNVLPSLIHLKKTFL